MEPEAVNDYTTFWLYPSGCKYHKQSDALICRTTLLQQRWATFTTPICGTVWYSLIRLAITKQFEDRGGIRLPIKKRFGWHLKCSQEGAQSDSPARVLVWEMRQSKSWEGWSRANNLSWEFLAIKCGNVYTPSSLFRITLAGFSISPPTRLLRARHFSFLHQQEDIFISILCMRLQKRFSTFQDIYTSS